MFKRIFLITAFILPALSYGAVYQCKEDGQTVFSDRPCGDNSKEIEVNAPAMSGGSSMKSEAGDRFVRIRELDRKIARLEKEKEALRNDMDEALIRWQKKKGRSANNLAGATWEKALAEEAEVMRKRYQSEIDDVDQRIDRLSEARQRIPGRSQEQN